MSTRLTSLPSTRFLLSICFHAVFYFFLNVILYRQALRSAGVSQECFLIMDYEAPALKAAKVFGFAIRGMNFFRRFFDVEILTGCCFHLIKNVNLRAHRCGLRLQCSDPIVAE